MFHGVNYDWLWQNYEIFIARQRHRRHTMLCGNDAFAGLLLLYVYICESSGCDQESVVQFEVFFPYIWYTVVPPYRT